MRLSGKVALITGGGSGIGKAAALAFSREGAQVVICGRRKEKLDQVVQEAGENKPLLAIEADLIKESDIDQVVQSTISRFQKIDILINNAGMFKGDQEVKDVSPKDWHEVLNINLHSVFELTRKVLPHMLKNGGGSIVHIASILGVIAVPNASAYNVSKGGLIQFSRSLAIEYGKNKIRSNCIAPGLVKTPMSEGLMQNELFMKELIKQYPIGFFGEPNDIAHACVYLASDEAKWVTGVVLPIDGGYTAA
jgi:NAD(P)-dependent dehydrogenase (short-subunit alcohol dehydrogenase family)